MQSRQPEIGPKAQALVDRDGKVVSHSYCRDYPFVMDHGKGAEVWDADGARFVDFMAGIAVNSTGHAHPEVVKVIQEQAEKFLHISSDFYHESMVRLSEKLAQIAPIYEDSKVFLGNSGTETVEAAIKLARCATGRPRFIGFLGAFHGRSMGSLAFTASKDKQQEGVWPTMSGVTHVPYPDSYRPRFITKPGEDQGDAVVDYIEEILHRNVPASEVAGVLVEPIQGEGGYIVPPPHFFPRLRKLCNQHGILLIADEVQSGIGRTGKMWAMDHERVAPDIVCSAKGIASGIPLGAMIARESIINKWESCAHGNTYGGNPIACVAALKTIELVENGMMQNAAEMGRYFSAELLAMQERHPLIGDVRGRGLMIGVELVKPETTEPAKGARDILVTECFNEGLLTLGCGTSTIRVMPPLMIPKDLAQEGLEMFEKALVRTEERLHLIV